MQNTIVFHNNAIHITLASQKHNVQVREKFTSENMPYKQFNTNVKKEAVALLRSRYPGWQHYKELSHVMKNNVRVLRTSDELNKLTRCLEEYIRQKTRGQKNKKEEGIMQKYVKLPNIKKAVSLQVC